MPAIVTPLLSSRLAARAKPHARWGLRHAIPRWALGRAARRGDPQALVTVGTEGLLPEEVAPLFEQVRTQGPLTRGALAFVTVDHSAVKEVLTSPDFRTGFPGDASNAVSAVSSWAERETLHPVEPPSLLATDGETHTRNRKLVTRVFTARAVDALRERTQGVALALLDELESDARAGRRVDLVERYCSLLPVTVIADILGVPDSEHANVLRMGTHAAASLDLGVDHRAYRRTESALAEFDAWLEQHLAAKRAHPGEDLFSQLVQAQDDGVGLSDRELKSVAGLVLAAGFETTVNLLSNAIRLLGEHPQQLAWLREEPNLWATCVEEVLRYDPPVLLTARTAVRGTTIAGRRIGEQAVVVTVLAGANRDPQVFDDPDTFDVRRENAREHLAFSAGRHFCLGAALSRMEGEVALRAFFERFDVELLPGARRRPTRILRGFETLPARLSLRR